MIGVAACDIMKLASSLSGARGFVCIMQLNQIVTANIR